MNRKQFLDRQLHLLMVYYCFAFSLQMFFSLFEYMMLMFFCLGGGFLLGAISINYRLTKQLQSNYRNTNNYGN